MSGTLDIDVEPTMTPTSTALTLLSPIIARETVFQYTVLRQNTTPGYHRTNAKIHVFWNQVHVMGEERSQIWSTVTTHLFDNETITIEDLDDYEEDEVRSVLDFMEDNDYVQQLSDNEWYVGPMMQNLRNNL
ncbi:hypothetical protein KU306_12115 [Haloferax larsenii]|uniref:Uncharacterized protein n=1 Tax=Haloferax larsenii TaxID=302484 RepID=A0ABY5RBB9_HALLR|nr:hypothetical protein [Haloferax larsenii]UVE49649.1 hypothetical protein KU306_12115 [Haloferax larsenii]